MKNKFCEVLEKGRVNGNEFATDPGERFGAFFVRCPNTGELLKIIASSAEDSVTSKAIAGGESWDHVSVSCQRRCPTWEEMCFVKDLFFDSHECVVQFHPPKENYVNYHPFVLHLWKPSVSVIPMPPIVCV